MSCVDWVGGDKGSSLFEEVIELSVFLSGLVVLHGLVGGSGYSNVNFGEFFKGKFFSGSDFLFFGFGLFPASVNRYSNSAEKAV
jgi:hypothetical protein